MLRLADLRSSSGLLFITDSVLNFTVNNAYARLAGERVFLLPTMLRTVRMKSQAETLSFRTHPSPPPPDQATRSTRSGERAEVSTRVPRVASSRANRGHGDGTTPIRNIPPASSS